MSTRSIMNPWIAKAVILAAGVVMVVIRAPHGRRSRGVKVARSWKGRREVALLTLAWTGFIVPLIWVVSPVFSFAEYYSIGQALVVPNWVVGPSYLVAFGILFALRIGAEERMMLETFGDEYAEYMTKTKLLVPGIW